MARRYHGIARIKAADGGVVGAGFLIAKGLVMTCAHNVTAAMGFDDLDYPGYPDPPSLAHESRRLLVDFPLAISEEDFGVVKIAAWHAPVDPEKSKKKLADVAVLELDGTPKGVSPVEFAREESYARGFKTCGFPPGRGLGTWAYGEIAEPVGAGLYEMHKVDEAGEQRDWFVEEGYSGSAAWSGKPDVVAGMIVFALGKRRAYMIPAERLKPVRAAARGTQGHAERESIDLNFLIDREGPLQHLATIRLQPDQCLLTLVIDGDKKQAPYDFLERIRLEGLLARFWRDEFPEFFHVAWLEERHLRDPRAGLDQLVARVASVVRAERPQSEDIRTAVNQAQEPFVFWSILRESAFGEDHLQLLSDWLCFWHEVAAGDSPGGPRLVRPVGVIICCEYGASAEAEAPRAGLFRRLLGPMRRQSTGDMRHRVRNELPVMIAPRRSEYLPELMGVPVPRDVEVWLRTKVRKHRPDWEEDRIWKAVTQAKEVYKGCDELSMQEVLERVPRLGLFR